MGNENRFEPEKVKLSPHDKTWILDLDGTIVVHDGPYFLGHDEFLPGAKELILINDNKPDGLVTAIAINTKKR